MLVVVDSKLMDIAHEAVVRMRIAAPDFDFILTDNGILVDGDTLAGREQEIRRLVEQTLYQQRIYRDTLVIRERIYNG